MMVDSDDERSATDRQLKIVILGDGTAGKASVYYRVREPLRCQTACVHLTHPLGVLDVIGYSLRTV